MVQLMKISSENIVKILNWKDTITAVQSAMISVTERRAIQNPRSLTQISNTKNILFTMPGYLNHETFGALGCKLVTAFPDNSKENFPSILANIFLFNERTGVLEAIIDGTEITLWRTAAASVVATKHIRCSNGKNNVLSIVGAGAQAKIHAEAFQEVFKFDEVRIWNRNYNKAEKVCVELNQSAESIKRFIPFKGLKDCVKDANVVITTTFSNTPLIEYEWLNEGVHINAVGAGSKVMELDEETYKSSILYVDHLSGVEHELKHLIDKGIHFKQEVGALINGTLPPPPSGKSTIFQSLGMFIEDCAVAKMVYNKYVEGKI